MVNHKQNMTQTCHAVAKPVRAKDFCLSGISAFSWKLQFKEDVGQLAPENSHGITEYLKKNWRSLSCLERQNSSFRNEERIKFFVITEVRTRKNKLKLQQERFSYGSHHACSKDFKHWNTWLKQVTEYCSLEVFGTYLARDAIGIINPSLDFLRFPSVLFS